MLLRRFYHVSRALCYPRVTAKHKETSVIDPELLRQSKENPPNLSDSDRTIVRQSTKSDTRRESIYVPPSKQIFSDAIKSASPKNIVQVPSSDTKVDQDLSIYNNRPTNFINVTNDASLSDPPLKSSGLQKGSEPSLPEPVFMDKRMEHFRSQVPQRITQMTFEQDVVASEFDESRSLFELRATIKAYLAVMDHVNFLDALTAFHRLAYVVTSEDRLQRHLFNSRDRDLNTSFFTREEMLNIPEFVVVVKGLVKFCRDFSADEVVETTSKLLEMKIPVDSLPLQMFLELLKTHVNSLTVNQLVGLFKRLSIAAESSMDLLSEDEKNDASTISSSMVKFMATLMATEKLILLRFSEEKSWLSCAEVIDIVTFVRESELTGELYNDALSILIENHQDLEHDSMLQLCRWISAQDSNSVVREEKFSGNHEIIFRIICDCFFELWDEIGVDIDDEHRLYGARVLLSAMVEVCSVESCVVAEKLLDCDNITDTMVTPQFCHASFDVTKICAFAETRR